MDSIKYNTDYLQNSFTNLVASACPISLALRQSTQASLWLYYIKHLKKKYSKYLFILNIFFKLCGIFYTKCKTLKIEEGEI